MAELGKGSPEMTRYLAMQDRLPLWRSTCSKSISELGLAARYGRGSGFRQVSYPRALRLEDGLTLRQRFVFPGRASIGCL